MNQHVRKTEKPKMKKPKTIQMQYPAPFSKSWSGPPPLNTKKGSTIRGSGQKLGPVVRKDTGPQLRCRGPDPAVPHLKYGLFPKKKGQACVIMSPTNPIEETPQKPRMPKEGETSEPPLFVVRTLDSRLTKRLSRAASTHLDIKPRGIKYI